MIEKEELNEQMKLDNNK